MEFQELLKRRQSCRAYDPARPVAREDLDACLDAVRLSPSACNAQPYHLTVCTGAMARQAAACVQSMGMNQFAAGAPCLIVFSESGYNVTAAVGSRFKGQDYRSVDIGIAAAHLTFAAADRGLGTCILGWFDEKKLQSLLHLKSRVRLVVALGWPEAGDPLRPKVRKDAAELADFRD